jgi:GT2 family glycosyltransferase
MSYFTDSISIIIVIYNTALEESESFESVQRMANNSYNLNLLVYDNSLEPQEVGEYAGLEIMYVHDPSNSGVSKAYNFGVKHAQKRKNKWALLLDQDTTLPQTILTTYENAVQENSNVKLFVPILQLNDGRIFSPCTYKFKRGFYLNSIKGGLHSLQHFSPVNSGMLISVKAFLEVGGYNDQVKLDFSDFQFIQRFRKKYSDFYVLDVKCLQDFSDDEISYSSQTNRYEYYCEGARNMEKNGWIDWMQYGIIVFLRALRLTIKYRRLSFLRTYLDTFLFHIK